MPQVTFTATPIKKSFALNEKVTFRFTVKNESESEVLVSPAFILNYDVYLEIHSSAGKVIPWCGVNARRVFLGDKYVKLSAGKTLSMERQVSCDDSHDSGYAFSEIGDYAVNATYRFPVSPKKLRDNPGPVTFALGPHKAETVHFAVVAKGS